MTEINQNSRTIETEKVYCPKEGVIFVTYDRRHRPVIKAFTGG